MKNLKKTNTHLKQTKEVKLPNEEIKKILADTYYQMQMNKVDNMDVDINHLENIFEDETYYLAMKIVPLLERKVLYLSFIENIRLNDICRRLKLPKKKVIFLKNNAITHFKNNLNTLNKAKKIKNGGKNES